MVFTFYRPRKCFFSIACQYNVSARLQSWQPEIDVINDIISVGNIAGLDSTTLSLDTLIIGSGMTSFNEDTFWTIEYDDYQGFHHVIENIPMMYNSYNQPIPEPSTMLLVATGLIGLVGFRKKFKK